jgi:hypothetical protein
MWKGKETYFDKFPLKDIRFASQFIVPHIITPQERSEDAHCEYNVLILSERQVNIR